MTKNVPVERIQEAFRSGARDFGENRVQELLQKKSCLPPEIRWHFIGHLQTNKVKSVLGETVLLHSLDRISLAEAVQKEAERKNLQVEALIQVNTTGEATKSGFQPGETEAAFRRIREFNRISVRGFMTIGPLVGEERLIRECFQKLRGLRDRFSPFSGRGENCDLSMGMSSDFEIAIEEGATIVRIGTAVFEERK